jgi:antitoxin component YwqK of YwqJK toxin-antitoxin module
MFYNFVYKIKAIMFKIKVLIAFLFLLNTSLFSQDNTAINQHDDKGKKHGIWKKEYSNGQIKYKGKFNHGKPVGTFKRYFPNGNQMAIMHHKSGSEVYTILFNKQGKKRAEGKYINKKKDSTWVFYGQDGNIVLKEKYDAGKRDGVSVKLYPDGDTSQIITYRNGNKHGIFKQFFPDGNLKLLAQYKNNELNGYVTIFSPEGHKEVEGLYRNNLREGEWVYYENATDTSQVLHYKNGEPLNENSLEAKESQEIIRLENNQGKFGDPRDELIPSRRKRRY